MDILPSERLFLIQKIKDEQMKSFNQELMKMIELKMWTDPRDSVGIMINIEKESLLKLKAVVLREFSVRRDKEEIMKIRKEMIRCGIGLHFKGLLEEQKIFTSCRKL